jgi:hypothetical protein
LLSETYLNLKTTLGPFISTGVANSFLYLETHEDSK